jgi:hypothetical protein
MTIRSDLSALDRQYRAKRSGQSKVEYAASIEGFRRPFNVSAWAVAITLALGFIAAIWAVAT